jgi:DNA-binding IclR family transcriptional regulator
VGKRIPSYETAIGRALLSRLPNDEALDGAAGDGTADRGTVRHELDLVFSRGLAATISTTIPGIAALAAAVSSPDKGEAIGFAISFPLSATDEAARLKMARWLRDEAASIAARIGDPYWAGRNAVSLEGTDIQGLVNPEPQAHVPAPIS